MSFFVALRRWRGGGHASPSQVPEEDSLYSSLYAVHRTTPQIIDAIEAGRDAMRLDDARALSEALTALTT